ncbi:Uncharacterized protein APZ42_032417 [Daphnia magna]|uniref:Retroviral polymerase SH3-like domain-containing protein n=1 Tax=Daphnia magna TaxID=35525 RepID=A0A162D9E2_9CRUS|nr:Uncharacterized protein APZ42_032417 [Daphnia magna]
MASSVVFFSSKDVSNVLKFDGNNFPFWKFQIFLAFEQHNLLKIFIGDETKPAVINAVDAQGVSHSNEEEIKSWCNPENAARVAIVATIEQVWQRSLINCKTANEMWKRLTSQHEQAALENVHSLLQRFFEYPYQKGDDVMSHITAIETFARQLEDLGSPLTEAQIITKITCTLPPSFRPLLSSWENLEANKKTLKLLTARLIKEESMNKVYGDSSSSDTAFFAKQSVFKPKTDTSKMSNKKVTFKRKCNYCDGDGHVEERCWQKSFNLKVDQSLKSNGGETQAKFAHHVSPIRKEESHQAWSGDHAFRSYSFFLQKSRSEIGLLILEQRDICEDSLPLQVAGYGDVPFRAERRIRETQQDGAGIGNKYAPFFFTTIRALVGSILLCGLFAPPSSVQNRRKKKHLFVHIPKEKRGKFDPKAVKCYHVGYCETQKAFRAWDSVNRKVLISRDVVFQELDDRAVEIEQPSSIFDLVANSCFEEMLPQAS